MSSNEVGVSKDGWLMVNNGPHGWGSNHWVGDLVDDWGVDGNWGLDWDIMDDLSDGDFWLDLGDLWGDLGVGSDWGQNLLLGHQWLEVSGLGGSDSDDGWLGSGNDGRSGFNDFGVSSHNWGSSSNWGLSNNGGGWSNGDGWEGWGSQGWDGWLDDGGGVSSDHWLGLVVHGLGDWDRDVGNGWSNSVGGVGNSWSSSNNWSGSNGLNGSNWGSSNNWSSHREGSSGSWEGVVKSSRGCGSSGDDGENDDQRVHFGCGF